ncbi:MAG: sulfatase [Bryobacteraceae bacterium]
MTRRSLVQMLAAGPLSRAVAAPARRPNVLYIVTDDQRWDLLSLRGHPFVKTPNMDRIGREGAVFLNSFVTTSLCSPSRATILTGRYAHQHRVQTNGSSPRFDFEEKTFPALLHGAGYRTAYVGKWHIGDDAKPRVGFDHWAALPGQGIYFDPTLNVNGTERKFTGHVDQVVSGLAVDFLKQQDGKKPFALCVGIKSPHAEQLPPEHLKTLFAHAEIPKPPTWSEDVRANGKADVVKGACIQAEEFFDGPIKMKGSYERFIKDFYRSVVSADEAVGRVLNALDETGQANDTLVVFAGDNGFFLGEHGLVDKRLPYEESMRIPLLMRYPAGFRAGQAPPQMALNLDICPTVLDFCGVPTPANVAGRSLRPVLTGARGVPWRNEIFYEYVERIWQSPALVAVRTDRYKYIEYLDPADTNELYDLAVDEHEMRNVIRETGYAPVLRDMKARLERLKRTTAWTPPDLSKPNTPCRPRRHPIVPIAPQN